VSGIIYNIEMEICDDSTSEVDEKVIFQINE